jgi:hypothetical protein
MNSFLFFEQARYTDFFEINERVFNMTPYIDGSSYPPFALLIALFFAKIIPGTGTVGFDSLDIQNFRDESLFGQIVLLIFYGIMLLVVMSVFWKKMFPLSVKEPVLKTNMDSMRGKIRFYADKYMIFGAVGLSVLTSAPLIYSLDRGNYLILAVLMLMLFCHFYGKNDYASAVFLALAACLKVYPVVFFLVFFLAKKWRPLITGLASGAVISALSMLVFRGDYWQNCYLFLRNLFAFSGGVPDDSSYYYRYAIGFRNLLATPILILKDSMPNDIPISNLTLLTGALSLILVIVLCCLDKRPWRQMMYLCFFMILFPTPSYFYNLSYLIAPVLLLLFKEEKERLDFVYVIGLALLMIPKNYHYSVVAFSDGPGYVGIETFLNPLIMCSILILSLTEIIRSRLAERVSVRGEEASA